MPDDENGINETDAEKDALRQQLADSEKRAQEADLERAKALARIEGLQEGLKQVQSPAPQAWSDEQWTAYTEKTGITREAAQELGGMMSAMVNQAKTEFGTKLTAAEKRAQAAEERAAKVEAMRTVDGVKADFFADKPALARYRGDVDAFLAKLPADAISSPEKLKESLKDAEIYVRGKVGDKVREMNKGGNTPRLNSHSDDSQGDEGFTDVDTTNFRLGEVYTLKAITKGAEREKQLKGHDRATQGEGISVSGKKQWEEEEARFHK